MRRDHAMFRKWGFGVVWQSWDAPLRAAAEIVQEPAVVEVHHHLHLPPGTDPVVAAAVMQFIRTLPQGQRAITTTITEQEGTQQS